MVVEKYRGIIWRQSKGLKDWIIIITHSIVNQLVLKIELATAASTVIAWNTYTRIYVSLTVTLTPT